MSLAKHWSGTLGFLGKLGSCGNTDFRDFSNDELGKLRILERIKLWLSTLKEFSDFSFSFNFFGVG